ncbi:hypothetical protein AB1Y20_019363 [Prymnesium parvum]|uniref:non-specific serine/threonine protein kinase n=1 Tax=Prymnesium parvum TaxID=97485 RepID=A0AB34JVP7_PRYPA
MLLAVLATPGSSPAPSPLPRPDPDADSGVSGKLLPRDLGARLLDPQQLALPQLRHDASRRLVTIEMTEATVVALYLSGCAMFIGGLWVGCLLWQRQARRPVEACECAWCTAQYQKTRKLAEGGFAEASLVARGGKTYVLKRIGCASVNAANQALMEASCLQRLRHPNVVRFEDLFMHRHDNGGCSVLIVMEYCAGGDLIDRLECTRGQRALSELQVIDYLVALCQALHHVHCCGILHRDLKSSNIFVTRNDETVKLGDFGLACTGLSPRRLSGSPRRMSRCGTKMYMSPEVAERKPYGASSDTYALGCVLLEMLLRHQLRQRRPFEERQAYIDEMLKLASGHGWASFDAMACLSRQMLADNPKQRIDLPSAGAAAAAAAVALRTGAPIPTPPSSEMGSDRVAAYCLYFCAVPTFLERTPRMPPTPLAGQQSDVRGQRKVRVQGKWHDRERVYEESWRRLLAVAKTGKAVRSGRARHTS